MDYLCLKVRWLSDFWRDSGGGLLEGVVSLKRKDDLKSVQIQLRHVLKWKNWPE